MTAAKPSIHGMSGAPHGLADGTLPLSHGSGPGVLSGAKPNRAPRLLSIKPDRISRGGYLITRESLKLPPGFRLLLATSDKDVLPDGLNRKYIDVTGRPATDLVSPSNLPGLLSMIDHKNRWSIHRIEYLDIRLIVVDKDKKYELASSETQRLPCPVKPHEGPLLPLSDELRKRYKYLFKKGEAGPEPGGHGRLLWAHGGKHYFVEKGKFETNPEYQGFACIGYVAAVCGFNYQEISILRDLYDERKEDSVLSSEDLLRSPTVNARLVKPEAMDVSEIQELLEGYPGDYFMLWSGIHVMIAWDGYIHEFNSFPKIGIEGYGRTPVAERLKSVSKKLKVAVFETKPALANPVTFK